MPTRKGNPSPWKPIGAFGRWHTGPGGVPPAGKGRATRVPADARTGTPRVLWALVAGSAQPRTVCWTLARRRTTAGMRGGRRIGRQPTAPGSRIAAAAAGALEPVSTIGSRAPVHARGVLVALVTAVTRAARGAAGILPVGIFHENYRAPYNDGRPPPNGCASPVSMARWRPLAPRSSIGRRRLRSRLAHGYGGLTVPAGVGAGKTTERVTARATSPRWVSPGPAALRPARLRYRRRELVPGPPRLSR